MHQLRNAILLTAALAVTGLFVAGCGGGGSKSVAPKPSVTGWVQTNATYVGRAACRDCHSAIDDEYAQQSMGDNASTPMSGADCGTCHATGYGEPSGFNPDGSTPNLDGIGCEDCHGPGSKHVKSLAKTDITRTPRADKTCWTCHGDRPFNVVNQPEVPVTAATLHDTAPSSVRGPHYPPAAFVLGRGGYNMTEDIPSPHSTLPNTCVDCHKPGISSVTGKVNHGVDAQRPNLDTTQPACASCHGKRSEQPIQAGITEALIELAGEDPANPGQFDSKAQGGLLGAYATAHNISLKTNTNPDDPSVIAYKGAIYNFNYVRKEGSLGVHNPGFAKRLIEDAKALLSQ